MRRRKYHQFSPIKLGELSRFIDRSDFLSFRFLLIFLSFLRRPFLCVWHLKKNQMSHERLALIPVGIKILCSKRKTQYKIIISGACFAVIEIANDRNDASP